MKESNDALRTLQARLQDLPAGVPDALKLRRERQRLLRAFEATSLPKLRPRWVATSLAAAVLGLAGVAFMVRRPWNPSWVDVVAGPASRWEERRGRDAERIELHDGHFQLNIHRPSASSHVSLSLPDGEIEDVGTVLEIWIGTGRTDYVAVQSGEVRLRLHGQPDLRLRAGEHWSRTSAPAAETTAKPGMPASSAVGNPEGAVPGDKSQGVASMRALRRSVPTRAPGVPQPSDGIAAEDAAYVAILSLLRHGDPSDALLSARDYLRRYPDGLRRPEVAQIAARLAGRPGLAPND